MKTEDANTVVTMIEELRAARLIEAEHWKRMDNARQRWEAASNTAGDLERLLIGTVRQMTIVPMELRGGSGSPAGGVATYKDARIPAAGIRIAVVDEHGTDHGDHGDVG